MTAPCYVAMGDSFTAGSDPGVTAFPDYLAAQLPRWRYLNLAVAGVRSAEVVQGQLEAAIAARPALVSVICGANDVVSTTRPDIEAFAANFGHLLGRLRTEAPGARVVTATYPAISGFLGLRARTRARMTAGIDDVNAAIRRLAAEYAAECVELAAHPGRANRENFAADGFHPSAAGHRRAALAFSACLRERLDIDLGEEEAVA